jgi:hypothetical protein
VARVIRTGPAMLPRLTWATSLVAALVPATEALPRPLPAQQPPPAEAPAPAPRQTPAAIRWGKWGAALAAVGFTAAGIQRHNDGNAAFAELVAYCRNVGPCGLAPDGRYANPDAESRYQRVVRDDRAARLWLVGGQVAALASAVLFILELRNQREPPNIPYSGLLVESASGVVRLGYRIPVRIGGW